MKRYIYFVFGVEGYNWPIITDDFMYAKQMQDCTLGARLYRTSVAEFFPRPYPYWSDEKGLPIPDGGY